MPKAAAKLKIDTNPSISHPCYIIMMLNDMFCFQTISILFRFQRDYPINKTSAAKLCRHRARVTAALINPKSATNLYVDGKLSHFS